MRKPFVPAQAPVAPPVEVQPPPPAPEPEVSIATTVVPPVAAPALPTAAKGYAVDDSVLAILREEAEREAQARRREARGDGRMIETQPDLGLDSAVSARPAPAAPVKRETVDYLEPADEEAMRPSARRDLLPDVEEINSSLRPSDRSADPDADVDALPDLNAGRNSFRSGFLIMIALAIVGLVAYLAAPQLSQQVPSLDAPLTAYVATIDTLRVQLDGLMQSATTALNGN